MKISKLLGTGVLLAGLACLLMPQRAGAQDQDPPGRVARMNYSEGSVSFQPGGEGDWLAAVPNRPLTTGDNLWADQGSRSELHVGSTVLRMGSETSMTFLNLDDHATQLRLAQGSLMLRVRHLDDDDDFEVDTPNLAFTVRRPGEYRIDVNQAGDTTLITVWKGQGEANGGGESFTVLGGQESRFTGTDQLSHDIDQVPPDDAFDHWAFDRDRREDAGVTPNYISTEMTGYEDLDDYGRWNYVAGYGNVWVPAGVGPGWAPYRNGHWAYVAPWGWTWVEDEPWGFAPFHYGRWAYVGAGWCWVPGPVVVRPVYAPALVVFVGGFGVAVGGGGPVGWFPLAPGEVFVPRYRVSRGYVNQVNITNTTVNITRVTNVYNNVNVTHITYVNQRVTNAVTVVPRDTFVNARPVERSVMRVDERQLAEAQVTRDAPEPVRASVLGAGGVARVRPPAAVERRQVVAERPPAAPRPSFEQRQPNVLHNETQPMHPAGPIRPTEARPNGPAQPDRPNETARPQEPMQANRPNQAPQGPERNMEPPQPGRNVPRPPEGNRAQEPMSRPEGQNNQARPMEPGGNGRTQSQEWSHPLAKPVPPPREMSPKQAQQEEQKYHNWQQQRPAPAPREAPKAPPREASKPNSKDSSPDRHR
jgi:hypothetical protein